MRRAAPIVQVDGVIIAHGAVLAVGRLDLAAADPKHLRAAAQARSAAPAGARAAPGPVEGARGARSARVPRGQADARPCLQRLRATAKEVLRVYVMYIRTCAEHSPCRIIAACVWSACTDESARSLVCPGQVCCACAGHQWSTGPRLLPGQHCQTSSGCTAAAHSLVTLASPSHVPSPLGTGQTRHRTLPSSMTSK